MTLGATEREALGPIRFFEAAGSPPSVAAGDVGLVASGVERGVTTLDRGWESSSSSSTANESLPLAGFFLFFFVCG